MSSHLLLIVSNHLTLGDLAAEPFGLAPEAVFLTRYDSLAVLGLSRFSAIVLHDPPADHLRKVALGLRDGPTADGLWQVLCLPGRRPVKGLVPAACRPPQDWIDLGLEPILPRELAALASGEGDFAGHLPSPAPQASAMLTADDVRELQQKGIRTLPAGARLTPWAREIADSLGFAAASERVLPLLIELHPRSTVDLHALGSSCFSLSQAHPEASFVLDPLWLPLFAEAFPALRNRMVSSTVHWAREGAFTGETSLRMLLDLGCNGALVSPLPSGIKPDAVKPLIEEATRHRFRLFSLAPLEPGKACDIMTPLSSGTPAQSLWFRVRDARGMAAPVRDSDGSVSGNPPEPGPQVALLVRRQDL